jgi:hypothetical protein
MCKALASRDNIICMYMLETFGIPVGVAPGLVEFLPTFGSAYGKVSDDGSCYPILQLYFDGSLPPGPYEVGIFVEATDGGVALYRDIARIELVNLADAGTPRASATPAKTPAPPQTPQATPRLTQTPSKSAQIYFTASFAGRSSRVRKIFRYSYLIPIILNR